MSNMQFAVKNDEQSNTVSLELKTIGDGIVELWGHGPNNAYLMGRFEDGVFSSYLHPPGPHASHVIGLPPIPSFCS